MIRLFLFIYITVACTPSAKETPAARSSPRQSAIRQTMPVYRVSREVYRTGSLPHHTDYLALGVPHEPVAALKSQIEAREGVSLIDRGEAHVTVITPPEFRRLAAKMTMAEIEWLARTDGLYEAKFEIACLGRAVKGDVDKTYFLVVRSPHLLNVRRTIAREFQARGGNPDAFEAEHFFPHVTVGYTRRDLHEADGVVKDATSCMGSVRAVDGLLAQ